MVNPEQVGKLRVKNNQRGLRNVQRLKLVEWQGIEAKYSTMTTWSSSSNTG